MVEDGKGQAELPSIRTRCGANYAARLQFNLPLQLCEKIQLFFVHVEYPVLLRTEVYSFST